MKLKLDKNIILENLGLATRPPVVQTAPGTPSVINRSNTQKEQSSDSAGSLPKQDLGSFADNQQKNESKVSSSFGHRFLLKTVGK